MPLAGHPDDCECCVRVSFNGGNARKRRRKDADLTTFLPEVEEEPEEEGEEEGDEEEGEDEEEEPNLIHSALFSCFDKHVESLDAARVKRVEILAFKSALEDDGGDEINPDATQDELDGLGIWQPGDERQGDVNFRTLLKLLTRVDQRGFERSSQQLDFHTAFMKASARVIYRSSWATDRPAIMAAHGWETSNSEVLISTPRRFGVRACHPPARRPHASHVVWRCLLDRKPLALPSSARALRSRKGSRSSSSRQPGVRAASCSSASSSS